MRYTVVDFTDKDINNKDKTDIIGLFEGEPEWIGEGNCMGWYGAEYYLNTTLLGYYITKRNNIVNFSGMHVNGDNICNKFYEKVNIGSKLRAIVFDADNITNAFDIFFTHRYLSDE